MSGQDVVNKDEGWLDFYTAPPGGTPVSRMVIREDGNVGIGTQDPVGNLHINDASSTADLYLDSYDNNNASIIHFNRANITTDTARIVATHNDGTAQQNSLEFLTGLDESTIKMIILEGGNVGIGTSNATAHLLTLKNTGDFGTETFISGITGDGFKMNDGGSTGTSLEIDNIIVRNTLRTHIFQKDVVKATNGILFVSDSGVIDYATATQVKFRADKSATFPDTTLMWYKDADEDTGTINSVKFTIDSLVGTTSNITTYNVTYDSGTWTNIATGSTAARFSGGTITIDASSANSPYIDINASSGSAVVRMGNLAGISTGTFTPGSVFGFWASGSAFLEGGINATEGNIGGWVISGDSIVDAGDTIRLNPSDSIELGAATTYALGDGIWLGNDGTARFGIAGFARLQWDLSNVEIYNSGNQKLVSLGAFNEIAGWGITTTMISSSTSEVQIDAGNSRFLITDPSGNEMVRMGLLTTTGGSKYGISGSNAAGELLFKLGEAGNEIAGWTIDPDYIGKDALRIDAANTKFIAGNSGLDTGTSNIRAVFGKYDGTNYGMRV
jgi:hypothetical protein